MASPPDLRARSMAARAGAESRSGRVPSQNQVWVSRRIPASPCATAAAPVSASEARGPSSLPGKASHVPLLEWGKDGGLLDITDDSEAIRHAAEHVLSGFVGWHQLRHRLPLLGDDHGGPVLLDFFHHPPAPGLELARRQRLQR